MEVDRASSGDRCGICGVPFTNNNPNCGGDCRRCMAAFGDPDCQKAVQATTFDRSDLLPHWAPTLQGAERAAKLAAWQARRACADCRHWDAEPGDSIGGCDAFRLGALTAPADHSCDNWEAAYA